MRTITKDIATLLAEGNDASPLPLSVIPNSMGINLCSVEALTWTQQDDGQLVSLTIRFLPHPREGHLFPRLRNESTDTEPEE